MPENTAEMASQTASTSSTSTQAAPDIRYVVDPANVVDVYRPSTAASTPPSSPEQPKKRSSAEVDLASDDGESEGRRVREKKSKAVPVTATTEQPPATTDEQPAPTEQAAPINVQAPLPPQLNIPDEAMNPGLHASTQDLIDLANKIQKEMGLSMYPRGKEPKGKRHYARAYKQRNPSHPLPPDLKLLYVLDRNGSRLWYCACKVAEKLDSEDRDGLLKNCLAWYHKEIGPEGDTELLYALTLRLIVQLQHDEAHKDDSDRQPSLTQVEHWLNAYKMRIITPDGRPQPFTLATLHQAFPDAKDMPQLAERAKYFCDYNKKTTEFTHKPTPETEDRIEALLARKPCTYNQLLSLFPPGIADRDFAHAVIFRLGAKDYTTQRWISRSIRPPPMHDIHAYLSLSGISLKDIINMFPNRIAFPASFRIALHDVAYPDTPDPCLSCNYHGWTDAQMWYPKLADPKTGALLGADVSERIRKARAVVEEYPEFFRMQTEGADAGCQTDAAEMKETACQTEAAAEEKDVYEPLMKLLGGEERIEKSQREVDLEHLEALLEEESK
ncbi:hypothetical protein BDV96DRAFT_50981 [Lophiotrema nucula]|uniref:Uncharacterized protein n=1 Tax=Lophiotrema nucula TaxID=690887 RepID=A0A6A5ZA64_9PLEO|nr:hypothetical protein BDV96DRAFT_50981 [Lophiotrema nucula]